MQTCDLLIYLGIQHSEGSDNPRIVRRRFSFSPIVADCSKVLGKPNGKWGVSEIEV